MLCKNRDELQNPILSLTTGHHTDHSPPQEELCHPTQWTKDVVIPALSNIKATRGACLLRKKPLVSFQATLISEFTLACELGELKGKAELMITPSACTRCKESIHASCQPHKPLTAPKATFVWHTQTQQGWFHFGRDWRSKGLVDQHPLPHTPERKSQSLKESVRTIWRGGKVRTLFKA